MQNEDFRTAWHRTVFMKSWYNSKNFFGILLILVCGFLCQAVLITPDQKVLIHSDQNMSIFLVNKMYNGNIGILWHRTLCMKTWDSSKFLLILLIFLV